jgi:hypothetical protein
MKALGKTGRRMVRDVGWQQAALHDPDELII